MPGGRKTRSGCARCKEKRLKCDETLPRCMRCTKAREVCPGYQRALRWSVKHQIPLPGVMVPATSYRKQRSSTRNALSTTEEDDAVHSHIIDVAEWLVVPSPNPPAMTQVDTLADQFMTCLDPISVAELTSSPVLPTRGEELVQSEVLNLLVHDSPILDVRTYESGQLQLSSLEPNVDERVFDVARRERFEANTPTISYARPSQDEMSCIWPVIVQPEYALVEYYFKEVATICSCYDGYMNPFRSIVSQLWTLSGNLTKTLQSMAAACLAPAYPHLAKVGFKLRQEVFASIRLDSNLRDSMYVTLLSAILLGQTSGWHNPRDLGLAFYWRSKQLLQKLESDTTSLELSMIGKDITFFQNAIGYWESMYAFIMPMEELYPYTKLSMEAEPSLSLIRPHPWAFATPELMDIVRQVGQLVWKNRILYHESKFWAMSELLSQINAVDDAHRLEKRLSEFELPAESRLIDPNDATTPVSHLLAISQAYRMVALMMLYRVFPDLLVTRTQSVAGLRSSDFYSIVSKVDMATPKTDHDGSIWLREFALYALQLVKSIPLESHTRCVQPFLLLALSSEMANVNANSNSDLDLTTVEARRFIQHRLEAFVHYLPPKPAQCRVDLVLEIWRNLDRGKPHTFWIDIVIEKDWRFLFG